MTTETAALSAEYLVTSCPDHGVKVAGDAASALHYQECAFDCDQARTFGTGHAADHARHGDDCWVCCDRMVIAPGIVRA